MWVIANIYTPCQNGGARLLWAQLIIHGPRRHLPSRA